MSSLNDHSLDNRKPPFIKALPIYLFHFVLLLLSSRSIDSVAVDNVHVIFFLIPLYYWVVHQPLIIPLWFVFLGGLFIDFTVDGLLGLYAFTFLLFYIGLYRIRRIILSQPYMYQYVVYMAFAAGFELLRWTIIGLLTWTLIDFWPVLIAIILNIVIYVPIMLVLKLLHRVMSGYGRAL